MNRDELARFLPYLPYSLNVEILNYQCDYVGVQHSVLNGYYMIKDVPHFTYHKGSVGKSVDLFVPNLRPMSELEPFMEHFYQETPEEVHLDAVTGGLTLAELAWLYKEHFDIFNLMNTVWKNEQYMTKKERKSSSKTA